MAAGGTHHCNEVRIGASLVGSDTAAARCAMPAVPDFRLYHSNALDVLAGLLAEQVVQLPDDGDWLRPEIVLVPQFSMRRWLQQALAERLGICANLRFLTPGEFVDLALDANLGHAPEGDRLAPESLRWHVLRELRSAPPAALAGFVGSPGGASMQLATDPLRAWSLANALAETYEKYQAWRRDWLLRWEQGAEADDWQATLWRRIARGRSHRARRIHDYLQRVREPRGLPPRLFVFACQNISPDVLQVIASQARAGEQHFYLHTPARAFWGDLERWSAYIPVDDDAFLGGGDAQPNPLLAAWGQAGRDFIAGLVSGDTVAARFELAPHAAPPAHTLLGRLQADVLDNRSPLANNVDAAWPRERVDRDDASLQFHACHTRLREVQVLHDQLRALLETPGAPTQPALQPRDIAVLTPDIDLYAPHIEAVFGGALGSDRELPYTIADASPLATAPLAEAFLRLLELPLRPLTVTDVLDLLAVPALAVQFDIDDSERDALQDWLDATGARWGLDAADRARHGAPTDAAYTFEFAIDRLLLGYATDADDDIAGVAPWPELEGQAALALDGLLRLLAVLRRASTRLAQAQPPAAWARELEELLDAAFGIDGHEDDDAAVLKALRQAIAGFAHGAVLASFEAPVEHAVVLDHFRRELGAGDARAPFLSGGICFGRMVPMRLIPFQVICLLGLDDGAFPARDGRDPVNRIAHALDSRERRVGDPSRRDADRYLFLQLFASAGRVFYLSWQGMDPRDNSRREPSALVTELLDAAACYHADSNGSGAAESARDVLVVRHALQPFSPAAFGAAHTDEAQSDPRRFSFDARWREAAGETAAREREPSFVPIDTPPLPPIDADMDTVVTLQRLRSALQRPHASYLRDGLGLRLPEDEPPLLDHEPFGAPDPLTRYSLREAVFARWLREGRRPDATALHATLLARALLAPGADGRTTLAAVMDELAPLVRATQELGFVGAAATRPFDLALRGTRLQGVLDGVQPSGVLRVTLRPEGRHGGHVLRHGLDHLVASLLDLPLHEIHFDKKGGDVQHRCREPASHGAAAALQALFDLRASALRAPLPFLPKSGYAFWAALQDLGSIDDAALAKAFGAAEKQWCSDDFPEGGPATRLALRGRDPFFDNDATARERFARIATAVFNTLEHGHALDAEALA
jgi:exodeoxyribonuclease V gamma subunit